MNKHSRFRWAPLLSISIALIMACNLFVPSTTNQPGQTQAGPAPTSIQLEASATPSPQITLAPTASAVPTDAPRCTVLQNLFIRNGPGTAYAPPIGSFTANTVVLPLAYNPVGAPAGSWVQVQDPASQVKGWISAGPSFVSCTIDLTTLSEVAVDPPPQPRKPHAQGSNTDGTCQQGGIPGQNGTYDCDVVFIDSFPMEFKIFKDGVEIGKADGVKSVEFTLEKNGRTIYSRTETKDAYCLFGGDGPCNSWILEDYVYKWGSGGEPIEPGKYDISINATTDDPDEPLNIHWQQTEKITLP